jgi:exonuclease III
VSRDQETISEARSDRDFFTPLNSQEFSSRIIIATHNVRGITRITDQSIMIEEIHKKNISIFGLSETKLTTSNPGFAFRNNNYYQSFSSAGQTNPYGSGVLLLI